MDINSLCHVEWQWRNLGARVSVGTFCPVVICVLENAGRNVHLSSVRGLSRRNSIVVMKLKSLAGRFQNMFDAKSHVRQIWTVVIPASGTAANAIKEECTFPARPTVREEGFAFTPVKNPAQRTAHHVLRNARIGVSTADALDSVWKLAHRAGNAVPGFAPTSNARSFAVRNATVLGATNHVGRNLNATTRVLVFVGNLAQRCAEFAIKTRLPSCTLELKEIKMPDSLSC